MIKEKDEIIVTCPYCHFPNTLLTDKDFRKLIVKCLGCGKLITDAVQEQIRRSGN